MVIRHLTPKVMSDSTSSLPSPRSFDYHSTLVSLCISILDPLPTAQQNEKLPRDELWKSCCLAMTLMLLLLFIILGLVLAKGEVTRPLGSEGNRPIVFSLQTWVLRG